MASDVRYADLTFPPIRERFSARHLYIDGEKTAATLRRLGNFAGQKSLNPQRLTMVTVSTICEFLGMPINWWRWLMREDSNSPYGAPPPPREPGGPVRGRGVTDLWLLELDIIPWLLSTEAGTAKLVEVLDEIKAARP